MTPALKASYRRLLASPMGLPLAKIAKASAAFGTHHDNRHEAKLAKLSCVDTLDPRAVAELYRLKLAENLHGYLTLTEDGLDIGVKLWTFAEREGMEV